MSTTSSTTPPGPGGVYLLDSSVLILSLRGDVAIRAQLAATKQLFLPSIALGELYFGAYSSPTRTAAALADIASLGTSYPVLGTDAVTAEIYGHAKQDLKARGLTMPDNDLWVAATALQYDITLAARDAHFIWITGLKVEQW